MSAPLPPRDLPPPYVEEKAKWNDTDWNNLYKGIEKYGIDPSSWKKIIEEFCPGRQGGSVVNSTPPTSRFAHSFVNARLSRRGVTPNYDVRTASACACGHLPV